MLAGSGGAGEARADRIPFAKIGVAMQRARINQPLMDRGRQIAVRDGVNCPAARSRSASTVHRRRTRCRESASASEIRSCARISHRPDDGEVDDSGIAAFGDAAGEVGLAGPVLLDGDRFVASASEGKYRANDQILSLAEEPRSDGPSISRTERWQCLRERSSRSRRSRLCGVCSSSGSCRRGARRSQFRGRPASLRERTPLLPQGGGRGQYRRRLSPAALPRASASQFREALSTLSARAWPNRLAKRSLIAGSSGKNRTRGKVAAQQTGPTCAGWRPPQVTRIRESCPATGKPDREAALSAGQAYSGAPSIYRKKYRAGPADPALTGSAGMKPDGCYIGATNESEAVHLGDIDESQRCFEALRDLVSP